MAPNTSKLDEKPKVEYIETIERVQTIEARRPPAVTFVSGDIKTTRNEPSAEYEGYHRYDPDFKWDPEEEKTVVRRLDWKVCVWVCSSFFALLLDRSNLTQALADNLLSDLKMNTNDYNLGSMIFNIVFLTMEIPMQLIAKRIGPDRWLPIQMIGWSLTASMQAFLKNRTGFLICRALLGLTEAGFIPQVVLYLSYFYTGRELGYRVTLFWLSFQVTQVFSAVLAYGILHLDGVGGIEGWRYLFGIEGAITLIVGCVAFFFYPKSPTQPSLIAKYRGPNHWFNEREEKILVNRILRDDPTKGHMHNREAVTPLMVWKALTDWHLIPIYILGLFFTVPFIPMTMYMTLTLRSLGFSTLRTSLLSIPGACFVGFQMILWTWISKRTRRTLLLGVFTQIWAIPLLLALLLAPIGHKPWVKWGVCLTLISYPNILPIMVSLCSRNSGSVRTRAIASALFNMGFHGASIIAANVYRDDDKPQYKRGNKVLLGICGVNICMFIFTKLLYAKENKRRDKIWNQMTDQERIDYLESTSDEGNKRLDFRFDM